MQKTKIQLSKEQVSKITTFVMRTDRRDRSGLLRTMLQHRPKDVNLPLNINIYIQRSFCNMSCWTLDLTEKQSASVVRDLLSALIGMVLH